MIVVFLMASTDTRSLSDDALETLRFRAVAMHEAGNTQVSIALALGVHQNTVSRWLKTGLTVGVSGLKRRKRGRRAVEQRLLNEAQEALVIKLITDNCPDQLKLPFALWTREAVRDLIEGRFGVRLALRTITDYLKRWSFTPQRPMKRAFERRDARVETWLKTDYPKIKKRAKKEGAVIHWGDETGLSNQANYGRSFAPKGQTPVIRRTARRHTTSMISSITNRGQARFMIYEGALNADLFLAFLKRLIKAAKQKVFLIVDNLRVHKAHKVTAWVDQRKDRIELFFLPAYAPEHNPDEFLNNDVKQSMAKRPAARSKDALKASLRSYMRGLQRKPTKVRSFFKTPSTSYAA
jgi:transposase